MIRILTDSSADFDPADIERLGLCVVPLSVSFGEETYRELLDISKDTFYEKMEKEKVFPKTSQPSPSDFIGVLEEAKAAGDTVIGIFLSSGLSGTWQGACLAKEMLEYENCYIVDSLTATCGMRILVEEAVRLRDEGAEAEKIVEAIEALKGRIRIYASLDTLENLKRGGRISAAAAAIGTAVQLKPVLRVTQEGTLDIPTKVIGVNRGIEYVAKQFAAKEADAAFPVYAIYAHEKSNAERLVKRIAKDGTEIPEENIINLGVVIGSHVGRNAFGIAFVEKQ